MGINTHDSHDVMGMPRGKNPVMGMPCHGYTGEGDGGRKRREGGGEEERGKGAERRAKRAQKSARRERGQRHQKGLSSRYIISSCHGNSHFVMGMPRTKNSVMGMPRHGYAATP